MKIIDASRGLKIRVSDDDYKEMNQYQWTGMGRKYLFCHRRTLRTFRGRRIVIEYMLHWEIARRMGLTPKKGQMIVFKDNDATNCQRENLLLANKSQNACKQRLSSANKSGVKGVCFDVRRKTHPWRAYIKVQGHQQWHKYFATLQEAAEARAAVLPHFHGEFARA